MTRAGFAAALLVLGALGSGCSVPSQASPEMDGQRFGLLSSLPIYRAPQASVAEALGGGGAGSGRHWLRTALEERNSLEPIDLLDPASLARVDTLLLIQPRALTPAENVALDQWVRGGGQVLLVADPMLTIEPTFALGDPRNPQAIAVTGPIHARWGLELRAGKDGDGAERQVEIGDATLPVALGGAFAKRPPAGGDPADCALRHQGLVAVCTIGAGRAVLVADATLFERQPPAGDAPEAFRSLLGMLGDGPAD